MDLPTATYKHCENLIEPFNVRRPYFDADALDLDVATMTQFADVFEMTQSVEYVGNIPIGLTPERCSTRWRAALGHDDAFWSKLDIFAWGNHMCIFDRSGRDVYGL